MGTIKTIKGCTPAAWKSLIHYDWQSSAEAAQIEQRLPPGDTRESAILATLSPGVCTATVSGINRATGIGMVEVYVVE